MQLSLETLNNGRFVPESNGEDLSSGYLQVPDGSVMLLTEAGIQEGNIVEKGLLALILTPPTELLVVSGMHSLKDVQDVMSNQNLRYAFPFSEFSFNTEIGFILLVEGRRSPFFTVEFPHVGARNNLTDAFIADGHFVTAPTSKQGHSPLVQERVRDQDARSRAT